MNRSKIADISEILSSIAILITLIYLTVEISQNTEALYAQSRQAILTSAQTELFDLAHNPEIVTNMIKDESLTAAENVQLNATFTAWMRVREFSWLQFQSGIIDQAQWDTEMAVVKVILESPRARLWWELIGKPSVAVPFANFVDELIRDQPASNDHWILNTNWSAQPIEN